MSGRSGSGSAGSGLGRGAVLAVGVGVAMAAAAGSVAGAMAWGPRATKGRSAGVVGSAKACSRRCFGFEPTEAGDGREVVGVAALGLGVGREVRVRLQGLDGPSTEAAARFAYEWQRSGEIELCLASEYVEGEPLVGELCTRDSCLSNALRTAGHGNDNGGER